MCYPKKFKLGHQTNSPRERVGPGDETRWYKRYMCCLGIDSPIISIFKIQHPKKYNLAFRSLEKKSRISVCSMASFCSTECTIQLTQLECLHVQDSWVQQPS